MQPGPLHEACQTVFPGTGAASQLMQDVAGILAREAPGTFSLPYARVVQASVERGGYLGRLTPGGRASARAILATHPAWQITWPSGPPASDFTVSLRLNEFVQLLADPVLAQDRMRDLGPFAEPSSALNEPAATGQQGVAVPHQAGAQPHGIPAGTRAPGQGPPVAPGESGHPQPPGNPGTGGQGQGPAATPVPEPATPVGYHQTLPPEPTSPTPATTRPKDTSWSFGSPTSSQDASPAVPGGDVKVSPLLGGTPTGLAGLSPKEEQACRAEVYNVVQQQQQSNPLSGPGVLWTTVVQNSLATRGPISQLSKTRRAKFLEQLRQDPAFRVWEDGNTTMVAIAGGQAAAGPASMEATEAGQGAAPAASSASSSQDRHDSEQILAALLAAAARERAAAAAAASGPASGGAAVAGASVPGYSLAPGIAPSPAGVGGIVASSPADEACKAELGTALLQTHEGQPGGPGVLWTMLIQASLVSHGPLSALPKTARARFLDRLRQDPKFHVIQDGTNVRVALSPLVGSAVEAALGAAAGGGGQTSTGTGSVPSSSPPGSGAARQVGASPSQLQQQQGLLGSAQVMQNAMPVPQPAGIAAAACLQPTMRPSQSSAGTPITLAAGLGPGVSSSHVLGGVAAHTPGSTGKAAAPSISGVPPDIRAEIQTLLVEACPDGSLEVSPMQWSSLVQQSLTLSGPISKLSKGARGRLVDALKQDPGFRLWQEGCTTMISLAGSGGLGDVGSMQQEASAPLQPSMSRGPSAAEPAGASVAGSQPEQQAAVVSGMQPTASTTATLPTERQPAAGTAPPPQAASPAGGAPAAAESPDTPDLPPSGFTTAPGLPIFLSMRQGCPPSYTRVAPAVVLGALKVRTHAGGSDTDDHDMTNTAPGADKTQQGGKRQRSVDDAGGSILSGGGGREGDGGGSTYHSLGSDDGSVPDDDPDAASLLALLPPRVTAAIYKQLATAHGGPGLGALVEVCVDEGRPVVYRLGDASRPIVHGVTGHVKEALMHLWETRQKTMPGGPASLSGVAPTLPMLAKMFGADKRMGIPGTLHRISAIMTVTGSISGLTFRVGRHIRNVAAIFDDILQQVAQSVAVTPSSRAEGAEGGPAQVRSLPPPVSLLLVGRPGLGKTTLLRDIARHLADDEKLAVVVVDTSLEIGGASSVPHPAIGSARRMEVLNRSQQHQTLIEAVQNHTPQVLVVDEIGTKSEAEVIRGIAQRGIAMLGTAHGTNLLSIMRNKELVTLVGGMQSVVLSDKIAAGGNKTRSERMGAPPFTMLIEFLSPRSWRLHRNLAESVDLLLTNRPTNSEIRWFDKDGQMQMTYETDIAAQRAVVQARQAQGPLPHTHVLV